MTDQELIQALRKGCLDCPGQPECDDAHCKLHLLSADRIAALQSENAEKGKEIERLTEKCGKVVDDATTWKHKYNKVAAALSRVEAERDGYKRALHLAIETHSVDQRQIDRLERYYLEQARGTQGEE